MKNSLSHQETPLLSIRHTYIRHTPVVSSILMCAASEGIKQQESQQPFVFPYVATPFLPYVQKIICVWLFVLRSSPRCAFVARRRSARLESSGGRWTRRPPGGRGATTARSTWLIASACSSCRGRGGSPIRSQRKKKKSPHGTLPLFLYINGILGESGKHTKRKKQISHARTYPWPTCYTPALPIHQWHFGEKAGKQTHTEKPCLSHAHVFVFPTSGTRVAFFVDLTGCFLCVLREQLVGQIKEMRAGLERHG